MALTNPNKLINVQELNYFEGKLAAKYQTQAIEATGITASTVVGALEELASAISALPSAIVPKGTKTFSELAPATDLAAANVGFMWNISDAFTTTSDFVEGAGESIPAGANVYVANPSSGVYKYDVFQGMVDLSNYKTVQTAKTDPSAGSTPGLTFIATFAQDANGEVTVTKETVQSASASQAGVMSAAHYSKLDAIAYAADSDIDEIFA